MEHIETSRNKVYYNAHEIGKGIIEESTAQHDVTRTTPVLITPREYYLAIDRFSLDGNSTPIYIMFVKDIIEKDGTTYYITGIKLTATYDGKDYTGKEPKEGGEPTDPAEQEFVRFESQMEGKPIKFDSRNEFFSIWSYQHLINQLNRRLKYITNEIHNDDSDVELVYPYFSYSKELQRFSLNVPIKWKTEHNIDLFSNAFALHLFESMPQDKYNDVLDKYAKFDIFRDGYNIQKDVIYPINKKDSETPPKIIPQDYIQITEEYDNFLNLSALNRIVFTTESMPITQEFVQESGNQGKNQTRSVLADFQPFLDMPGATRSKFLYNAERYRLIDMHGDTPLYRIDFKVWWIDVFDKWHPLKLFEQRFMDVKFAFIKKSTFQG